MYCNIKSSAASLYCDTVCVLQYNSPAKLDFQNSSLVTIQLLCCDPFPIQTSLTLSRYKICIVTHSHCLSSPLYCNTISIPLHTHEAMSRYNLGSSPKQFMHYFFFFSFFNNFFFSHFQLLENTQKNICLFFTFSHFQNTQINL